MSRHTGTISRKAKLFLCCPFHIDLIHRNIQRLRNVPAHLQKVGGNLRALRHNRGIHIDHIPSPFGQHSVHALQ